jgi:glutaredoxin
VVVKIVVYQRPNCPLCDEAREALAAHDIPFDEVDVSADEALESEYGPFVPVVEVGGRIVFHTGMDASELPGLVRET